VPTTHVDIDDANSNRAPPLAALLEHASSAVAEVMRGHGCGDAIDAAPVALRAGTRAIAFHALRNLGRARAISRRLITRKPEPRLHALIVVALSLLVPTSEHARAQRYAEHTVVDQAVTAARHMGPVASERFVNAVLRRFLREREALLAAVHGDADARYEHPAWWVARLRQDWPAHWERLLEQARHAPPMTLRVNESRVTVDAYLEQLAAVGLFGRRPTWPSAAVARDAAAAPQRPTGAVVLDEPCPVARLPGFAEGLVSVQDAAAQCAAPLLLDGLERGRGLRVLDACAAPGGKTAHLLEIDASLDVTALDADAARLERVADTLRRLQGRARLVHGDARDTASWWDGRAFDAILIDAPCTASGIVRRHPDIPWLRQPGDVERLAQVQGELLDALTPLLAPGGRLVHATCSIFAREGEQVLEAYTQRAGSSSLVRDPRAPGHLLPLPDNGSTTAAHDGFFYARLHRPSRSTAP
jgi:16S rRNA (cytosine967-C5)-methyltransferase